MSAVQKWRSVVGQASSLSSFSAKKINTTGKMPVPLLFAEDPK
jgi:hypothetical protein